MQNAVELRTWPAERAVPNARVFAATIVFCVIVAAALASWLPLQVSIVTLFLFAGPHNWFELRYFLMRLPMRFGRSRNFFLTAFIGLGVLTLAYVSLPFIYNATLWTDEVWSAVIAVWNTLLLLWLAVLVRLRSKQKRRANWTWTIPLALALASLNWLGPISSVWQSFTCIHSLRSGFWTGIFVARARRGCTFIAGAFTCCRSCSRE